jgi:hypothetical protein
MIPIASKDDVRKIISWVLMSDFVNGVYHAFFSLI